MKIPALVFAILVSVSVVSAQEIHPRIPRFEVFGGGSMQYEPQIYQFGVQSEAVINLTRNFALVGDFGRQARTGVLNLHFNTMQALVGPQIAFHHRLTPFVHALAGYSRDGVGEAVIQGVAIPAVAMSGVGLAVGGGIDLNLNRHLGLRLVQADWTPSRINGIWYRNQERIGVGVVIRFGGGRHQPGYRDTGKVVGYVG